MSTSQNLLSKPGLKSVFLVWGTPDQGPRSRVMADKLGIQAFFVHTRLPRGALFAAPKYAVQSIKTLVLLFRQRPRLIFVQNPPLLAVFFVYVYCALTGSSYIVDAHSAAFMGPWGTIPPTWTKRFLSRRAITTLVTNERLQQMITELGGHGLVVPDIPTTFDTSQRFATQGKFNVAFINTFSCDEPLAEALQAARDLPDVHFYVTGKVDRRHSEIVTGAPANVHFTGFLPDETYYGLLNTAQAIMCMTTRNHTMQRGACEALWLGKPIITSDWPILRRYFNKGTVHVDNSVDGIRRGVSLMMDDYPRFSQEIIALQTKQQQEWQATIEALDSLIAEHVAN